MSPALSQGGPLFPGPDPGRVWVQSGDDAHPVMVLRALDGGAGGASILVPAEISPLEAVPDEGGYLPDGAGHRPRCSVTGTSPARSPNGPDELTAGLQHGNACSSREMDPLAAAPSSQVPDQHPRLYPHWSLTPGEEAESDALM